MKQLTAQSLFLLNRIAFQGGRCNHGQTLQMIENLNGSVQTSTGWCQDMMRRGYMERVGRGKYVLTEKARAAVEVMRREAGVAA